MASEQTLGESAETKSLQTLEMNPNIVSTPIMEMKEVQSTPLQIPDRTLDEVQSTPLQISDRTTDESQDTPLKERVLDTLNKGRLLLEKSVDVASSKKYMTFLLFGAYVTKGVIDRLDTKFGWSKRLIDRIKNDRFNRSSRPDIVYGDSMAGRWVYVMGSDYGALGHTPKYALTSNDDSFDWVPVVTSKLWALGKVVGGPELDEVVNPDPIEYSSARRPWLNKTAAQMKYYHQKELEKIKDYAKVQLLSGREVVVHRSFVRNAKESDAIVFKAAWEGDVKAIDNIFTNRRKLGATTIFRDAGGMTPLHYAAGRGHSELVHSLIFDHKVAKDATDYRGITPLWVAAKNGFLEVVKVFIRARCDLNLGPKGYGPLYVSGSLDRNEVVDALLKAGADSYQTGANDIAAHMVIPHWVDIKQEDENLAEALRPIETVIRDRDKGLFAASDDMEQNAKIEKRLSDIGGKPIMVSDDADTSEREHNEKVQQKLEDTIFRDGFDVPLPKEGQTENDFNQELFRKTSDNLRKRKEPIDLHHMGICYFNGFGVNQNFTQAMYYFERAWEEGWVNSAEAIALAYLQGKGYPKDPVMATEWFGRGAENGDSACQYNLGLIYLHGDGLRADVHESIKWLQRSSDNGHANASFALGTIYIHGKDEVKPNSNLSRKYIKTAVDQGSGDLNFMFVYGAVLKDQGDYVQAHKVFFELAKKHSYPPAMYPVAMMMIKGEGTHRNKTGFLHWLEEGATHSDIDCLRCLGGIYWQGDFDFPRDREIAVHWFRKGAELGDTRCQYALGQAYMEGSGVDQNDEVAKHWLIEAAKSNFSPAIYRLQQLQKIMEERRRAREEDY